jgi:hypothetical protein
MVLYDSRGNQYAVKFAEKAENGTLGLAREYLGGTLAEFVGAPVPSTTFVELTSTTLTIDPNIAFEDGSRPAPQITVGSSYLAASGSPAAPDALTRIPAEDAAGILVFNTWVSVGDRHWGNYLIRTTTNGPRLVSIDYATCLSTSTSIPMDIRDPDLVAIARSVPQAVEEFLRRLKAVSDRAIGNAISQIPRAWMDDAERHRIGDYLLLGRAATRALVTSALA